MKKILLIILASVVLIGCNETSNDDKKDEKKEEKRQEIANEDYGDLIAYEEEANENVTYEIDHDENAPVAVIIFEDGSKVAIELYPEYAPETVSSFIYLANEVNFYDDLIFHRIIEGFMIQGGCPYGTGSGGPGYNIPGEFSVNNFDQNIIENKTGTIAMARSEDYNSAGSQFFINVADNDFLDGNYAAFGKVIYGYDTVLKYSQVETNGSPNDKPIENVRISSIRVDTKGETYYVPEDAK